MQAEIQTKVKISVSEIKKILAEKFCLYHDFELELVEDSVVEPESVEQDNEGWIDVPKDWKHYWCPTDLDLDTELDIIQRNGVERKNICVRDIDTLWVQEDYFADIVKYRVSKLQSN